MLGSLGGDSGFYFRDGGDALIYARYATVSAFEDKSLPGCKYARLAWPARGSLPVSYGKNRIFVGSHAHHGSDSVGGVGLQILFDVFRGEELRVLRESLGNAEMHVKADHPRHDVLALKINGLGSGWRGQSACRSNPGDAAVVDEHGAIGRRGPARAIDQNKILDGFHFGVQRRGQT